MLLIFLKNNRFTLEIFKEFYIIFKKYWSIQWYMWLNYFIILITYMIMIKIHVKIWKKKDIKELITKFTKKEIFIQNNKIYNM